VVTRQREIEQMEELVGQTYAAMPSHSPTRNKLAFAVMVETLTLTFTRYAGLDNERQKALLLVRNFDPALADALLREFEEE